MKLTIEDLKELTIFPLLDNFVDQFEVAQFRKDTRVGKSELDPSTITWDAFENSYAYEVANRLRPIFRIHKNLFGTVLVFDNYFLRLK